MTSGALLDAHAHVIGDRDRYPFWAGRTYEPPDAPLDAYLSLLNEIGLTHGVLVQPSVYGFDNRCMLDALDAADGRLFGIAVPEPRTAARELESMHRRGVRGVRCNLLSSGGGLAFETVIGWRPALRDLGWHVELHVALETAAGLRPWLERFEVPVVIDHMGRPGPDEVDPANPRMRRLIGLVREGACFVKLSAPYRLSGTSPPWPDVTPLARALLAARPEVCLWATDWPHTDTPARVRTVDLIDALADWCPAADDRRALLGRAARLFGLD